MKVLILGGNGFIGGHLVDAFQLSGSKVRVLDRPHSLRTKPIAGVDYRHADFQDQASLAEALVDIDLVLHLVSSTVPSTSNLDPIADIESNLVGSVRLLQQMRQVGTPRIIFLSSGGTVYGNPKQLPVSESHPLQPISSYGVVKVAIENYLNMYQVLYGLSSTVLRVSNPYGPRQAHIGVQGAIPTFFNRILSEESIKIWGEGEIIRDYIFIDDLVQAIMAAANQSVNGVFNIGAGSGVSLIELLKTVGEVAQVTPKIEFLAARDFDVKETYLDITKAKTHLGWEPTVSLRDGCERYWAWLKSAQL